MTITPSTRRAFLGDAGRAATAAWLSLPWLAALAGCIRDDALTGGAFAGFIPAETRAMEAFASRILPSVDGAPGAVELGAVAVRGARARRAVLRRERTGRSGRPGRPRRPRAGAGRDARVRLAGRGRAGRDHAAGRARHVLHGARTLVVIGTFADPSYGGNRARRRLDDASASTIGPTYTAPFGWYDAPPDGRRRGAPHESAHRSRERDGRLRHRRLGRRGRRAREGARDRGLRRRRRSSRGPWQQASEFTHDELAVEREGAMLNTAFEPVQTFRTTDAERRERNTGGALLYRRGVGGSSVHFSANYWRFRPIDFKERSMLGLDQRHRLRRLADHVRGARAVLHEGRLGDRRLRRARAVRPAAVAPVSAAAAA